MTQKSRCIISKNLIRNETAQLTSTESRYPFEMVPVSLLRLDICKCCFEYILIVTGHFKRFTQAYAIRNKSAKTATSKLFNNFMLHLGFPTRIHHDRSAELRNYLFNHLHKLYGISTSTTTAYHSMSNGLPERIYTTMINVLKTIPANFKANWKDQLAKLTFPYNSTVKKSTGFVPFDLMFGAVSRISILEKIYCYMTL